MKVCTDATLFGAMAPINGGEKVLDIGTGTGLLALMAAQLGAEAVTAVELTAEACSEATINFHNSPWTDRLEMIHQDIQSFIPADGGQYDLIISNPPFFDNHTKTTESLRNLARHTDRLPYADLLSMSAELLSEKGLLYLLIPTAVVEKFSVEALNSDFHLIRQTDFRGYVHNDPKVSAVTYSRTKSIHESKLLTIYQSERVYSDESERYLSPFLLRFSEKVAD